jgi:peroxiredoxin
MTELGQLEAQWQEFDKRKVRVVVVSMEDQEAAKATQEKFPHLEVVSDEKQSLTKVGSVIHPHSAPHGGDTAAPATLLIDGQGKIRWTFRPEYVFTRLSPAELLSAIDKEMPAN